MSRKTRSRHRGTRKTSASKPRDVIDQSTKLLLRGAHAKALEILSVAVAQNPDDAAIVTRHADALYLSGRISEARDAYRHACALDETEFQAWYGCGYAEFACQGYARAIVCLQRALALEPQDIDAHYPLGKSLFYLGETDPGIEHLLFVAVHGDAALRRRTLREIAFYSPQSPSRGNAAILKARRKWAALEEKIERPRIDSRTRRNMCGSKLRIGYVSAFFDRRNYMKPVWGVLNGHDRSAFEIHLFLDGENPSSDSGYRRHRDDSIHLIGDLSNKSAAERVAAAGIDVLIDLNGYSAADRFGLFMRKPAPVVAAWFNLYATSGIRAIDYIIGDAVVIPPEEERFYSERVLRVSGSYLAFSVLYPVPPVEPPPCLRSGEFTFGCLAPNYKITDDVISAWAQILHEAPEARLLLKNTCMDDPSNQAAMYQRFARCGVAQEQVVVEGQAEHYEFLKTYNQVDIALDTFPYNGGSTTAEALWQGVPVLAFHGDRWVSRMSCSTLLAAGLGDWAMASLEEYLQRAIALALSPDTPAMLAALRARMRKHLLASPACDTTGLCRELEGHYLSMARLGGANARRQRARTPPSHQNGL
jgi:protein O-GlcNAc transferase